MGNNGFTEEDVAKIKNCQSVDELKEVARDLGTELSDEEIEDVAGGDSLTCTIYHGMGGGNIPLIAGEE